MKTISNFCRIILLLGLAQLCQAQQVTQQTGNLPPPTSPVIVSRAANARVWQWTEYEQGPNGETIPIVHSYTEAASGLCFLTNGVYADSQEQITIQPDGSGASNQGQHQAYYPVDIYNGVITLAMPGLQLSSQPIGLCYADGTRTVLFAELTNSTGQIISPNQILYTNAFTGIDACLLYTYTRAGFAQDLILEAQPPPPEAYGLNPQTTQLQLLTEFFNPPQPTITTLPQPGQGGAASSDELLGFGSMEMVPGRAFLLGSSAGQSAVTKQWISLNGRQILVEQVPVAAIADDLSQLPASGISMSQRPPLNVVSATHLLPPRHLAVAERKQRIEVAQTGMPKHGLLLDYQIINGTATNMNFQGDLTFFI